VRLPDMHSFTDSTDAMQAAVLGFGAILARSRIVEPYIRDGRLVRLAGRCQSAIWILRRVSNAPSAHCGSGAVSFRGAHEAALESNEMPEVCTEATS